VKACAVDVNTSRTPEEGTHSPSWPTVFIIIIIIIIIINNKANAEINIRESIMLCKYDLSQSSDFANKMQRQFMANCVTHQPNRRSTYKRSMWALGQILKQVRVKWIYALTQSRAITSILDLNSFWGPHGSRRLRHLLCVAAAG
jgi:hypothetical protein